MIIDKIELNKSLETGIGWQDRQHRELFVKVNTFVEALENSLATTELLKLLDFLDDYVVNHFHDEEQFMSKFDYPDLLLHIEKHTSFIEELDRLKGMIPGGINDVLLTEVNDKVSLWITHHIGRLDKEFGL
ncbi:MAG: hemerythrin family protein, partial [Deltaproteobacteria bacterium]|nr:hemerythrin family protein [Deltaproteobacteria bacterium]